VRVVINDDNDEVTSDDYGSITGSMRRAQREDGESAGNEIFKAWRTVVESGLKMTDLEKLLRVNGAPRRRATCRPGMTEQRLERRRWRWRIQMA